MLNNGLSEYLRSDPAEAAPSSAWLDLDAARWAIELGGLCCKALGEREKVILCITGKAGSGKSTLGRYLRKRGLPGIPLRQTLVIDDGMAHLKWLGLLPRRIKHRCRSKDYLAPFAPYFADKRLLIYVNTTPEQRIDACDILLRLHCADHERQSRLVARDPDGAERYGKTAGPLDEPRVQARQYCQLQTDHPALPALPRGKR